MNIELIARQDDIAIGKLSDEDSSGVYLSSRYIARLAEVHEAATRRIASLPNTEIPDAVRNLLGILGKLFYDHAAAVQPEQEARGAHDAAKLKEAREELARAKAILDSLGKR